MSQKWQLRTKIGLEKGGWLGPYSIKAKADPNQTPCPNPRDCFRPIIWIKDDDRPWPWALHEVVHTIWPDKLSNYPKATPKP